MKKAYAMETGRIAPQRLSRPTIGCIGCGCSELHACPGPCCWIVVDEPNGVGICSACVDKPIAELERSLATCPGIKYNRWLVQPQGLPFPQDEARAL